MNERLQNIVATIRQNESLTAEQKDAILRSLSEVDKELEITLFKLDRTEKVKRTTAILLEETIEELEQKRKDVEEKNRELEIEAALERVRSRAMSMQDSSELNSLVGTVFTELTKLDLVLTRSLIMIFDPETNAGRWWMANSEAPSKPMNFLVKYHDLPFFNAYLKGWKDRNPKWVFELEGKDKIEVDDYLFTKTELSLLPDFVIEGMKAPNKVWLSACFNNFGCLNLASLEPLPDEHFDILIRFAKVFDLTYTRFNDLKQAEAQAREAKIEAALEKVRSRSLAMHKSDELQEVVNTLFEKLQELDIQSDSANIAIFKEGSRDYDYWVAGHFHKRVASFHIPYTELLFTRDLIAARESGTDFFAKTYSFEEKNEWFNYAFKYTDFKLLNEERKQFILDSKAVIIAIAFGKNTGVQITNYSGKPVSESEADILKRFSKVFEQAYTRFLDLQKAEAQAREAQIEAALERVRGKAMAMHSSKDLTETIKMFYLQMKLLVGTPQRCGVSLFDKETHNSEFTSMYTTEEGESVEVTAQLKMAGHPMLESIFKNWLLQKEYHPVLRGNEIKEYYQFIQPHVFYPDHQDDMVQYGYYFFFKEGTVYAWTEEELREDELQIYRRFTSVISLTYKRYNDLKLAEAQAREAKIELGLERVRARAMAMQNSDELSDLVSILFEELTKLDMVLARCIIWIFDENSLAAKVWMANSEDKRTASSYHIKYLDHPYYRAIVKGWKERDQTWVYDLKGSEKKSIDRLLLNETELSLLPEAVKSGILNSQHTIVSGSFNNFGLIEASGPVALSAEQLEILSRFAKVFDLTYTRFSDLKQAEAQAREANIEASLERVRSKAMAMQKSEDLADAVAIVFEELDKLNLGTLRCGIGIINKEKKTTHSWATSITDKGKSVQVSGEESLDIHPLLQGAFDAWCRQEDFDYKLQGEDLQDYYKAVATKTTFQLPESQSVNLKEDVEQFYFLASFQSGGLFAFRDTPFPDEARAVIKRFADVFNLTYTRFNDLKVAEAHARQAEVDLVKLQREKKRAEDALAELRTTQAQLIQSEKMASLGELTAGIAHEIQNPLNFINNFSEVSAELADEIKEALNNNDKEEAIAKANDIRENLEKITHHGKRADGIVKGMLQHSRASTGKMEPTDINTLADEYLRLSFHGLRAKDKTFNATLETNFDQEIGKINIISHDVGRVILNLFTNAFYSVTEKKKILQDGYMPTVSVSTKKINDRVEIRIKDNGIGIPQKVLDKIYQPFFTTKPTGKGTGLGLSLSYDIIKAHNGQLTVETREGEFAEFIIQLPVTNN